MPAFTHLFGIYARSGRYMDTRFWSVVALTALENLTTCFSFEQRPMVHVRSIEQSENPLNLYYPNKS